jgi:myo-inositol-1(or 4)-monophosphatase
VTSPDATPDELRDLAVELARRAGRLLTSGRPEDLALGAGTKSSPTDLVTVMDRAAERLVLDGLRETRPDDSVLAEESGGRDGSTTIRWIIDPLDGTVNYFYGIPAFGVSIAAEVEGEVVAGAVFSALTGTVYDAVLGAGARADGRTMACRQLSDLSLALVGTGFSYSTERRVGQGRVIAELLPRVRDMRRMGAAALDLCAVGDGHLDAFFELGLPVWDYAAGLLVATEAGAVTGTLGTAEGQLVVAAAPGLFGQLVGALEELYDVG